MRRRRSAATARAGISLVWLLTWLCKGKESGRISTRTQARQQRIMEWQRARTSFTCHAAASERERRHKPACQSLSASGPLTYAPPCCCCCCCCWPGGGPAKLATACAPPWAAASLDASCDDCQRRPPFVRSGKAFPVRDDVWRGCVLRRGRDRSPRRGRLTPMFAGGLGVGSSRTCLRM